MSKMKSGIRSSYNQWASQYDTNLNKTRDLEAVSLRTELVGMQFRKGLEMGCGTGKNTSRLLEICESVTAIDFSEGMLSVAKQRIPADRVCFLQADIQEIWPVEDAGFDLVTFSLVLEHIENLDDIFLKASQVLIPGGMFYLGEFTRSASTMVPKPGLTLKKVSMCSLVLPTTFRILFNRPVCMHSDRLRFRNISMMVIVPRFPGSSVLQVKKSE